MGCPLSAKHALSRLRDRKRKSRLATVNGLLKRLRSGPAKPDGLTPELRNAIVTLSAQPKGGTSEAFAKLIAAEVPKWAGVIQLSGTRAY